LSALSTQPAGGHWATAPIHIFTYFEHVLATVCRLLVTFLVLTAECIHRLQSASEEHE
jgi:hypothetical protein